MKKNCNEKENEYKGEILNNDANEDKIRNEDVKSISILWFCLFWLFFLEKKVLS